MKPSVAGLMISLLCSFHNCFSKAFLLNSPIPSRIFPSLSSLAWTGRPITSTKFSTTPDVDRSDSSSTKSSNNSSRDSMKHVKGIRDISQNYDVFLLDMWGVMHDGSQPYEGVIDCVKRLKSEGKRLIILSNSSKRIDHSKKMLRKLGFDPDLDFDDIITSGEVSFRLLSGDPTLPSSCTWSPISKMINDGSNSKKQVLIFGSGDQDVEYIESAGWNVASSVDSATLLVARGTFTFVQKNSPVVSKKEDETRYNDKVAEILELAAKRRIPMLVCNPDKVRPDEGLPPMPGAIGDAYVAQLMKQNDGGDSKLSKRQAESLVKRIGKPYKEVYDLALGTSSSSTTPIRSCMVGDAIETDITGGSMINDCDTIWVVQDGIHGPTVRQLDRENGKSFEEAVASVLDEFNEKSEIISRMGQEDGPREIKPSFITSHFQW